MKREPEQLLDDTSVMRADAEAFLQGEAWEQFEGAANRLISLLDKHLDDDKLYPGLPAEQSRLLLIGHSGLKPEFGNGIGFFATSLTTPSRRYTFDDRLRMLVNKLTGLSQLANGHQEPLQPLHGYLVAHNLEAETGRDALWRCADHIMAWSEANCSRLSPETKAEIREAATEYCHAYPEVIAFLGRAEAYLSDRRFAQSTAGRVEGGGQVHHR